MDIAILTIGDELLNGDLADTNTAAIAGRLLDHGYRVREAAAVGDCEDDMVAALQRLAATRDVVIVTGGLGPTEDDLTARAAAKAFGRHLSLNETALRQIKARFAGWGRTMHPRNEKQALLPVKARVVSNPRGTAPGFQLATGHAVLYVLPGVPHEMLAMLEESVLPDLVRQFPEPQPIVRRTFTIFGLPEPEVESRLLAAGLPEGVELAFAVDLPLVIVKLGATGNDAGQRIDRAELVLRRTLDDYVVGSDGETLAGATARLLVRANLTVSLAESCTGGLIAKLLTDIPGSSRFFERSGVTYADAAKSGWLGVSAATLASHGAVSAETARAMAVGVRRVSATSLALAVTGIAGPDGGTAEKPVGTVYLALADDAGVAVERFRFHGDRGQVRLRTACTALDWLRRKAMNRLEDAAP